jgi:DNA relaxase NicK
VVYGGGSSEWPHIEGTGPDAVAVARLLRSREWPHRVSRADVCVDTDTPGAFAVMLDGLRAVKGAATKAHMYLPDDDAHGRTYYVGAKTSEVQARLYEKGKQLPEAGRPDWVRYEVQIRPQKDRKAWAASTSASDLLGAARWSERFVTEVLGVAASAAPTRSERVSDLEGAIAAMCHQYGNRLLELVESHGGDVEAFGLELLARAQNGGKLPA